MATGQHNIYSTSPRRSLRTRLQGFTTVTLNHEKEAILLDLSESGLRLQSTQTFKPGTELAVAFFLPNSFTLIEGMATIVWSDVTGQTGVRFNDADMQEIINEWVAQTAGRKKPVQSERRPTVH